MNILPMIKSKIKKVVFLTQYCLKIILWLFIEKKDKDKRTAFVFKVSKWKQPYIIKFFPEYRLLFLPSDQWLFLLKPIIRMKSNKVFIIWGYKYDTEVCEFAHNLNIPVYRLEDGFIRSVGLGSMHAPPYSLCLDKKGIYFDSTKPSDLEDILNTYDFSYDQELLDLSIECLTLIKKLGVSKYNHVNKKSIKEVYGEKIKKRILVIGQVEDDASILKGSNRKWTNNELVQLASEENPESEIIYKPHPDVLTGRRPYQSNPKEIKHLAKVIEEPLSLVDSLQTIDHVYTITSLSGFEALIRGITVTTVGAPFYSGWGLTDDRQIVTRRRRTLCIEELFAGAYLLYPRYFDPNKDESINLKEAILRIASVK